MATESDIRTWIRGYVRDFNQLCQALMWQLANRFGTVVSTPGSASAAAGIERNAGRMQGGTPPPGTFVYFDIGADGHVGFMLNDGRVFMGTRHVDEQWSNWNTGPQGIADYCAITGARYIGWSTRNGGNSVPFTPSGGGGGGETDYHWYALTAAAMKAVQQMLLAAKYYDGPDDGDFGYNSVVAFQRWLRDNGYLPADYRLDGVPHNEDKTQPSNYGYAVQNFAKAEAGYDGYLDGLPGEYTSEFLVTAANKVRDRHTPPPPPPPPPAIPDLPPVPAGFVFLPDLATSQSTFDFAEYVSKGGAWVFLKAGGANTSDSPYTAPAYEDQLSRGRPLGVKFGHYFFNGRKNGLTPETCMDYFAEHADIRAGDLVGFDIEDETATETVHWSPEEAVRAARRLDTHFPGIRGLAYMSDSVADADEWDELVALGWGLWNASWGANGGDPGTPPTTDDWPEHLAWQYTSVETVPGNYRLVGGGKVYQPTDGSIARADLFDLLGYRPEPKPEPDRLPAFLTELNALIGRYQP